MDISAITKENFCETVASIYMVAMGGIIVQGETDIFGLIVNGEPIAPFWAMSIICGVVFGLWMSCRYIRKKVP